MEEYVDEDDIGVQAVDSRRKNEVKSKPANPAIPRAANGIQEQPSKEVQQVESRDGRHAMPDNGAATGLDGSAWLLKDQILNPLRIKMNLAKIFLRKAFE